MGKQRGRRSPAWGKLLAIAVAITALAAAWRYTPLSEYITAERVTGWARAIRGWPWAPPVVILLYTPAAFVMFPRPVLTLLTVVAFGPWLGFVYSMLGIILSALATYYVGRLLPEKTIKRLAGDKLDDVIKALRRHGVMAMLAVRIIPVAPFGVEGIIAGAVSINVWEYTLGTFLGMLPGVLATSIFGHQLTHALEDPSRINWWIVGGVVAAMAALTWYVKRWFARQSA
jgi:uncharacterized membrane protein YdjX (TVP38/TMEM64 family)